MALGSCQFGFLKEPKDSHGESSIMRTLAKVSSFKSPRQARPWQTAPAAPSYGLHVFSAGPRGWHGRGSVVVAVHPSGATETFGKEGICAKGGCVAGSNGAGEGGKTRFSFSG